MQRERITLTKWKLSGAMIRAGEYAPGSTIPLYDWQLDTDSVAIGRITIEAVDNENKFRIDNVELVIQNSSKYIPALKTGIDYRFFKELATAGYYYEVTIEVQANEADDAIWMTLGSADDEIAVSHLVDVPPRYDDPGSNEKWVAGARWLHHTRDLSRR
jgi:hypothetical protein